MKAKKKWELTRGPFDKLLAWFDTDRQRAGLKHEKIRSKLMEFFENNGCHDSESSIDETIDRVAKKLNAGEVIHTDNPNSYFKGVAKYVLKEYLKEMKNAPIELNESLQHDPNLANAPNEAEKGIEDAKQKEYRLQCLEKCLQEMPTETRALFLQYHQEEKFLKIKNRKKLAQQLGILPNALRIRIYRIKEELKACVEDCLKRFVNS